MSPSVTLGVLLGSVYGLLAHLFVGRAWRELPIYWLAAVGGFFGGFAGAVLLGVELVRLGTVPLLEATLGSLVVLAVAGGLRRRSRPERRGRVGAQAGAAVIPASGQGGSRGSR